MLRFFGHACVKEGPGNEERTTEDCGVPARKGTCEHNLKDLVKECEKPLGGCAREVPDFFVRRLLVPVEEGQGAFKLHEDAVEICRRNIDGSEVYAP